MFCVLCCRRLCLNISLGFFLSSYLSFAKIIYAFVNINLPDGFLLYVCCACREYLPQISRYCTHWFGSVWLVGAHVAKLYEYICRSMSTAMKWKWLHKTTIRRSQFPCSFSWRTFHLFIYDAPFSLSLSFSLAHVIWIMSFMRSSIGTQQRVYLCMSLFVVCIFGEY